MTDAFISYSRKDSEFVRQLHSALSNEGRNTWVDWEDIPLTADWWREICEAIEGADSFVFIISPDSIASRICQDEIEHAVKHAKRMVPVLFRDIGSREAHRAVTAHNWVMMRDDSEFGPSLKRLLSAMDTDLEHCKTHTRLLQKALEWDHKRRDRSFLLRGIDLQEAEVWLARGSGKDPVPTDLQQRYVNVSRRSASFRTRLLFGATTAGFLVTLGLSIWALTERQKAIEQKTYAQDRQRFATEQQKVAEEQSAIAQAREEEAQEQRDIAGQERDTARSERDRASRSARMADSRRLAALASKTFSEGSPVKALLLAVASLKTTWDADGIRLPESDQALRELKDSAGTIVSRGAAWASNDGRWILVHKERSSELRDLWNPSSRPLQLSERISRVLAMSSDSRWLLTQSSQSYWTPTLWDLRTAVSTALKGHQAQVTSGALSADGRLVVTGAADGMVRLWDVANLSTSSVLPGQSKGVNVLAISPDGHWIAAGAEDGAVRIWDHNNPGVDPTILTGHSDSVKVLSFSPDSQWILSGSRDRRAIVSNVSYPLASPFVMPNEDEISSALFSPDGRWVITAARNALQLASQVRVWDWREPGKSPLRLTVENDPRVNAAVRLAVSRNSRWLASGASRGSILLVNLQDPSQPPVTLRGHESMIEHLAMTPDSDRLISVAADGTARSWDIQNPFGAAVVRNSTTMLALHMASDRTLLITGKSGGQTRELREPFGSRSFSRTLLLPEEGGIIAWAAAISPDGRRVARGGQMTAAGTADFGIRVWNLTGPAEKPLVLSGHEALVTCLAFGPGGLLVTGSADNTARVWRSANPLVLRGHRDEISAITISKSGRLVVTGSRDGRALVWDLTKPDGKPLELYTDDSMIYTVAISPDDRWVLTGSPDPVARLWDIENPSKAPIVLRGHTQAVRAASFSPDGRWIVTGSIDQTARIWDRRNLSQRPAVLWGHEKAVEQISITPDSRWVVTGSEDSIRRWMLQQEDMIASACNSAGRNFTPAEWAQEFGPETPFRKICPGN